MISFNFEEKAAGNAKEQKCSGPFGRTVAPKLKNTTRRGLHNLYWIPRPLSPGPLALTNSPAPGPRLPPPFIVAYPAPPFPPLHPSARVRQHEVPWQSLRQTLSSHPPAYPETQGFGRWPH